MADETPARQGTTQAPPAAPAPSQAPTTPPVPGRRATVTRWLGVAAMLYLLVCAIGVIGDGFNGLGAGTAENLFDFATNPIIGLFVGILVTAIIQSSSTTTTLVVTAVGTGMMPVSVAIPMIMGANVGTSVTNTLASLGHVGDKAEFRRAFAASTVHDFFNLIAVAILLPLEMIFHPLERLSETLAGFAYGTVLPDPDNADVIGAVSSPVVDALGMQGALSVFGGGTASAVATIVLGVALIFLAVRYMGKLLQVLMVGKAKSVLERTVGGNPLVAMGAGMGVTAVVQSSSVTTSMLVPFAGSGSLTTRQIYPLTLGANIGTTVTALLAAFAVTGGDAQLALQAAFVHLLFNVVGILVIYGLPFLRWLPVRCAEVLAAVATEHKTIAAAWVITVFLAIPAAGIFIHTLF
ncbi:Na/Pi cotransporter family protein [Tomitella fengzijianii]|uniref:Na/Pi cotransporter family protein n=2 Tax=Tomitella fengzijianii TaxID=2597660 RepID=A0A516X382_9ACTN|nr:Na/Pi symporter [Tomitella fengzijianii]QDQ97483.1 Na/Pi cotransporter family protein [Tomitella fengzijianii]